MNFIAKKKKSNSALPLGSRKGSVWKQVGEITHISNTCGKTSGFRWVDMTPAGEGSDEEYLPLSGGIGSGRGGRWFPGQISSHGVRQRQKSGGIPEELCRAEKNFKTHPSKRNSQCELRAGLIAFNPKLCHLPVVVALWQATGL